MPHSWGNRDVPKEHRTGYGPRLTALIALIAERAGTQADSRSIIQTFCDSVLRSLKTYPIRDL